MDNARPRISPMDDALRGVQEIGESASLMRSRYMSIMQPETTAHMEPLHAEEWRALGLDVGALMKDLEADRLALASAGRVRSRIEGERDNLDRMHTEQGLSQASADAFEYALGERRSDLKISDETVFAAKRILDARKLEDILQVKTNDVEAYDRDLIRGLRDVFVKTGRPEMAQRMMDAEEEYLRLVFRNLEREGKTSKDLPPRDFRDLLSEWNEEVTLDLDIIRDREHGRLNAMESVNRETALKAYNNGEQVVRQMADERDISPAEAVKLWRKESVAALDCYRSREYNLADRWQNQGAGEIYPEIENVDRAAQRTYESYAADEISISR